MAGDVNPTPSGATSAFFLVTLLLAFSIGLLIAASSRGVLQVQLPESVAILIIMSPTTGAFLLTVVTQGWRSVYDLLAPVLKWRIPLRWYLLASLLPVGLNLTAIGLNVLMGGSLPVIPGSLPDEFAMLPTENLATTVILLSLYFLFASLVEEIGWRGYALPRLQSRYSALVSSLIVGVIWAVWHIPTAFLLPGSTQGTIPFHWYVPSVLAMAVIFTWLYNHTGGSLLLVTLLHASIQVNNLLFPVLPSETGDTQPYVLSVLVTIGLAICLVAIYGSQDLSRGKGNIATR